MGIDRLHKIRLGKTILKHIVEKNFTGIVSGIYILIG